MKKLAKRENIKLRVFAIIILIVASIIVVIPYIWMLSNSFKSTKEAVMHPNLLIPENPTIDGYVKVLTKSPFFSWLKNSVIVTGVNTIIVLFTSTLLGYVFARFEFKGRQLLFNILMYTMMVPAQVTMITSFLLIDSIGLYDNLLALIIPAFVNAFGVYLCKQYIEEIPKSLIESARIDGASDFMIYWKIVIPQIRPAIGSLAIFTFLQYWNDYLNPLLFLSSKDRMTLPLALSYFSTQHTSDLSAVMAASALIMIPSAIVFIIFQKQFVKGIAMTGMK